MLNSPLFAFGFATCILTSVAGSAQLIIEGGSVTIGANASIVVKSNLTSNTDILGNGKLIMNGSTIQRLNMNGFAVPNLEVNSNGGVALAGNLKISASLFFSKGKIQANNYNVVLSSGTIVTGAGEGKFVETNGSGQVQKEVTAPGNYSLPVGTVTHYMPIEFQIAGAIFSAGAYVGTQLAGSPHPNRPIRATDHLSAYWKPTFSGITGNVDVIATYVDGATIGNESLLNGLSWNGTDWSLLSNSINTNSKTVTFNSIPLGGVDLYAMNKFLLCSGKVFLQGAYNESTGKMNDDLRQAPNLIPLTDPYRTAPYNTFFTHVDNNVVEVANASVFESKTNDDDNIVDWVFLQLRNSSNVVVQTRSALLQKDGDIVDVDGTSPVFFKNVDAGSFVLTVRHRNHLGLSAEPANFAKLLSVANPTTANKYDFTTASDDQIFGTNTAYYTNGSFKFLWSGNVNANMNSRYTGPSNDHSYLLTTVLKGDHNAILTNVYSPGDLNLNRNVSYTGPANDHSVLLSSVLTGNGSAIIFQQIPN